jgi:cold shock CspA family protein
MKGIILNFKVEKGFGFILGEDNKKYFFHISNVFNPMDIERNYNVDFTVQNSKKGLNAINITIRTPLYSGKSRDKMLIINSLRIRASDIKTYQVEYDFCYGSNEEYDGYVVIDTYSGKRHRVFLSYCKDDCSDGQYQNNWRGCRGYEYVNEVLNYLDEELNNLI